MDQPEAVSTSDRLLTIGILAHLGVGFMDAIRNDADAAHIFDSMIERYRSDLARQLGHVPDDDECHRALEGQVHRLRVSIGEYG